jgi:hypothetical protein
LFLLFGQRGYFGRALLEFDRIHSGVDGCVDHLLGDFKVAIVIDPDLGNDIGGMSISDQAIPQFNFSCH